MCSLRSWSLAKVQPFREIEPSRTAKASDSIVLCASDVDKVVYSITLEMDQWSGNFNCNVTVLIIYMKKLLDSDWLRSVQFKCNTSAKSVTPVQKCNTSANYTS